MLRIVWILLCVYKKKKIKKFLFCRFSKVDAKFYQTNIAMSIPWNRSKLGQVEARVRGILSKNPEVCSTVTIKSDPENFCTLYRLGIPIFSRLQYSNETTCGVRSSDVLSQESIESVGGMEPCFLLRHFVHLDPVF